PSDVAIVSPHRVLALATLLSIPTRRSSDLALLPSMAESVLTGPGTLTSGLIIGAVLVISAACQLIAPVLAPRAAQTIGLSLLGLGSALLLSSNLSALGSSTALVLMVIAAMTT